MFISDWNMEKTGHFLNMLDVPVQTLANLLKTFYCEARPKNRETKNDKVDLYHKNALISIRAAIYTHLTDIHRDIDIVKNLKYQTVFWTVYSKKERDRDFLSRLLTSKSLNHVT